MTDRIEQIRRMLADDPADVFLHYSLAMELASVERFDEAVEQFKKCLELDPTYLAAYVEAGKCLRSAGRLDEARATFAAGMKVASTRGETHTADFIRQQLEGLPQLGDR